MHGRVRERPYGGHRRLHQGEGWGWDGSRGGCKGWLGSEWVLGPICWEGRGLGAVAYVLGMDPGCPFLAECPTWLHAPPGSVLRLATCPAWQRAPPRQHPALCLQGIEISTLPYACLQGVQGFTYDYYEDLTPDDIIKVIDAFKKGEKPKVRQSGSTAEPGHRRISWRLRCAVM